MITRYYCYKAIEAIDFGVSGQATTVGVDKQGNIAFKKPGKADIFAVKKAKSRQVTVIS